MPSKTEVSADILRETFHYNPTTGELRRKGSLVCPILFDRHGEPLVRFHRKSERGQYKYSILAKRVAWAIMTRRIPSKAVSYRNGEKRDLRWGNLTTGSSSIQSQAA